jgi:Exopolysaccharide biosynthesis protein YbjH
MTFLLSLLTIAYCPCAFPRDEPFDNEANWGGTGLMEIPTARVLDDETLRFGVGQALPYRWFTGGMGIFPGLELSGGLTEITNLPASLGPAYGANKDKEVNLKYQVLPESRWLPAIALGWNDFYGTQLFESKYIAVNRQIFPFDFTLGYGTGRLKGPFGGIELSLDPKLSFMAEYNPIKYQDDKPSARGVPEGADSPVNVGLRFKPYPGIHIDLSYQRGQEIGMMLYFQADIGKPIFTQRPNPPPLVDVDRTPFKKRDLKKMVSEIHEAIHKAGFAEVSVYTDGETLTAEFENTMYLSDEKAAGRVLRILLLYSPSDAKKLQAVIKRRNIPILEVSVAPDYLEKYLEEEIPEDAFNKLVDVQIVSEPEQKGRIEAVQSDVPKPLYGWGIKPEFTPYLNDPSGFFKARFGLQPRATLNLWKGAQLYSRLELPVYSNISSSNTPVPNAVRSDSWKYLGSDITFDSLLMDQIIRISDRTFGRLSLGYLEFMYAGAGGEVLRFFGDGNLALGFEADWARKREPGSGFGLLDFDVYDVLADGYYHFAPFGITFQAQYGRFLAGDVGWLFTVSRQYDTGVTIGGWYSLTDTNDLTDYNKGYNEKGVFITLPLRIFLTKDSPQSYTYAIAPWSRDVAARIYHWQTLYGLAGDLMPGRVRAKLTDLTQ